MPAPGSESRTLADPATKSMDDLVALCKRRGFVYPASEIYGGINGFWDYGPLGTALKNNIRDHWWKAMVECPPIGPPELTDGDPLQIVGLDSAIIQNPKTWVASGHVGGFSDPRVDCKKSKGRYRADHVLVLRKREEGPADLMFAFVPDFAGGEEKAAKKLAKKYKDADTHVTPLFDIPTTEYHRIVGPEVDEPGTLTEPRQFNLMFESETGAVSGETMKVYLRPETAQGIFLNYKNIMDTMRVRMPFGVAQIGKSFRNEVTPRNFIFRSREFEQMEMEWFCPPEDSAKWYEFWRQQRYNWWLTLGVNPGNLQLRDHEADELSHYSTMTVDIEYKYPFTAPGFGELEGIAHRGCFDLAQHQEHSKQRLDYFDQQKNERYVPHVIEPASGLTRAVLVLLCECYTPDPARPSGVYFSFRPKFAPIKAGIFPLVNKDGMPEKARNLYLSLREKYTVEYDAKQNIGKRYARMDEVGTPFCFTIDGDTLRDDTVTVRHRDTQQQERININQADAFLAEKIG